MIANLHLILLGWLALSIPLGMLFGAAFAQVSK